MATIARRCARAATALLLATTLPGCSDASDTSAAEPDASGTPTGQSFLPSPSPTTTETPPPPLPEPPPAKNTPAGREAFAEFVVERWGYALRTNDADALTGLSPQAAPCQGCVPFEQELAKRRQQRWYVDFPGAEVVKVDVAQGELPGVHLATATINVPASRSYFEDGELRNENQARKRARFEVRMRFDAKRYVLLAFRVF